MHCVDGDIAASLNPAQDAGALPFHIFSKSAKTTTKTV
ncbi:hypothetical protein SAMN05880582_10493 [Rhizobium sp. RU20A]|nr:hypothetical protein SAMN05880582_10493 [Rhizobium sp. RU20A]